jgi:hypothetical protein
VIRRFSKPEILKGSKRSLFRRKEQFPLKKKKKKSRSWVIPDFDTRSRSHKRARFIGEERESLGTNDEDLREQGLRE